MKSHPLFRWVGIALALSLQGCATRTCAQRSLTAAEFRWELQTCAVSVDRGADVEVIVRAENLSARERQIAKQPIRFAYGRAKIGEGVPTSWGNEGSANPSGESTGYTTVAPGEAETFRRSVRAMGGDDLSGPGRGEALYLGTSMESPTDAQNSTVDLGEFVVEVSTTGEVIVKPGREPMF